MRLGCANRGAVLAAALGAMTFSIGVCATGAEVEPPSSLTLAAVVGDATSTRSARGRLSASSALSVGSVVSSGVAISSSTVLVCDATDAQGTQAARVLLGASRFDFASPSPGSVNRDFDGVTYGGSDGPELNLHSGWAYIESAAGYNNTGPGRYRPIVRTRRVIAMCEGLGSLLILNDSGAGAAPSAGDEEFIVNRSSSGGAITLRRVSDGAALGTVPAGMFIRVSGDVNAPTADAAVPLDQAPEGSKLKAFLESAREARESALHSASPD